MRLSDVARVLRIPGDEWPSRDVAFADDVSKVVGRNVKDILALRAPLETLTRLQAVHLDLLRRQLQRFDLGIERRERKAFKSDFQRTAAIGHTLLHRRCASPS